MFTTMNEYHRAHDVVVTLNHRQSNDDDVDSTSQRCFVPGGMPEKIHISMVIVFYNHKAKFANHVTSTFLLL